MKIVSIETMSFLGVPDGRRSVHPGVALVTGGPASGKSGFLRAVLAAKESAGPYMAPPSARAFLRRGASQGSLRAEWQFSETERRRSKLEGPTSETRWNLRGAV